MRSDIRYTRASGAAIAYQVVGEGSDDLVYVADYMSNLVFGWEWPRLRDLYLRLASFSRLILFDKRGTGLSDHTGTFPSLDTGWKTCGRCSTPQGPCGASCWPRTKGAPWR